MHGVQEVHETAEFMPARREQIDGDTLFPLELLSVAALALDLVADACFYLFVVHLTGALLRPRTNELFWSTTGGHLLTARLRTPLAPSRRRSWTW